MGRRSFRKRGGRRRRAVNLRRRRRVMSAKRFRRAGRSIRRRLMYHEFIRRSVTNFTCTFNAIGGTPNYIVQQQDPTYKAPIMLTSTIVGGLDTDILGSPTAAGCRVFGACNFSLDRTKDYTDLQQLYDSYKIKKVVMRIIPLYTQSVVPTGQTPMIYWQFDRDDSTVPTDGAYWMDGYGSGGVKRTRLNHPVTVVMKPRLRTSVTNNDGTISNSMTKGAGWINTVDAKAAHYGLKFAITDLPTYFTMNSVGGLEPPAAADRPVSPFACRIEFDYHIVCRDFQKSNYSAEHPTGLYTNLVTGRVMDAGGILGTSGHLPIDPTDLT